MITNKITRLTLAITAAVALLGMINARRIVANNSANGNSAGQLAAGTTSDAAALPVFRARTNDFIYTGGVVFNTDLPGLAGQLVLNVYLAVDPDGTGLGTLSDVLNKDVNSHLAIERASFKGDQFRFEGVVLASNTPGRAGQPFVAEGEVTQQFTSLAVALDEGTFTGKGFFVSSSKASNAFRSF